MKKQMVVTNLRMEKNAWRQVKAEAGELGMSANEYLNYLAKSFSLARSLGAKKYVRAPIWDLPDLAKKYSRSKGLGLSKEDVLIYGV